jgi:hypothetical protein
MARIQYLNPVAEGPWPCSCENSGAGSAPVAVRQIQTNVLQRRVHLFGFGNVWDVEIEEQGLWIMEKRGT